MTLYDSAVGAWGYLLYKARLTVNTSSLFAYAPGHARLRDAPVANGTAGLQQQPTAAPGAQKNTAA